MKLFNNKSIALAFNLLIKKQDKQEVIVLLQ